MCPHHRWFTPFYHCLFSDCTFHVFPYDKRVFFAPKQSNSQIYITKMPLSHNTSNKAREREKHEDYIIKIFHTFFFKKKCTTNEQTTKLKQTQWTCDYSFGDGVQYPVQIKHFPGTIGNTSNYESMGNSYSLNKFEPNTANTETNDSQKNLLVNQSHETTFNAVQSTTNEPVNCVDRQLPTDGVDAELTVVNETIRNWHAKLVVVFFLHKSEIQFFFVYVWNESSFKWRKQKTDNQNYIITTCKNNQNRT